MLEEKYKYKLTIEYCGRNYFGMQKQSELPTIQKSLETAISQFLNKETEIDYAGRTDKGVNATGQVIHFECNKILDLNTIKRAVNYYLFEDEISVLKCEKALPDFHSRFSAKSRSYIYKILNRPEKATFQNTHLHYPYILDINLMNQACKFLTGKHDFSSFRSIECQAKSPIKTIEKIEVCYKTNSFLGENQEIYINITAPSFLHQMVRIITGTLLLVGKKKIKPEQIKDILNARNRKSAGDTAPAHGLFLSKVEY